MGSLPSTETPWHVPGKWWMSCHNWATEVRKQMPNLPERVEIRDATFREADDQMGVYLSIDDKVKLALKVSEIGIRELDIGGPTRLPHQAAVCKAIRKAYDEAGIHKSTTRISGRYFGVAKDHRHEIDAIIGSGATDVRLCIMSPTIVGVKEFDAQLPRIREAVEYCHKQYDATITVGIDDATRTDMEHIETVYKAIVEAGADKAWFADTHGVAIPNAQRYLAMEIKKIVGDMPLACHIHDQHGMGVASTLGAVEGGTNEPDCTWNGYGDQAGNACLEELVCNLEMLYGVNTGIKLERLTEVSEMVEKMCGVETQRHKAYTGKDAFAFMAHNQATATGMMLAGVPREEIPERLAKVMPERERLNPAVLGRKAEFAWGYYGSRRERVIEAKLASMGLRYASDDIRKIQDALVAEVDTQVALNKELMAKKRRAYLTDEEFERLVREIMHA